MKEKKLKKILDASYQNEDEAAANLEKMGYKYDKELSKPEHKVFVNPITGVPQIAFRGSKTVKDWTQSNLPLLVGLEQYSPRFQESKHITQLVEQKYKKPANVYGHSLGGALAEKSGAKGRIYTDNKGAGILDIGKTIPKNQIDYRTQNDLPSFLSLTQNYNNNNIVTRKTDLAPTDILGNHSY